MENKEKKWNVSLLSVDHVCIICLYTLNFWCNYANVFCQGFKDSKWSKEDTIWTSVITITKPTTMAASQKMEPMAAIWYSSNNQAILDSVNNISAHLTSIYGKPKNNDKKIGFRMNLKLVKDKEISAKE